MNHRDLFKSRRVPSLAESLAKRSQNAIAGRQEKQREYFWSKRGQAEPLTPTTPIPIKKKKPSRAEMLQKWKAEKMKKIEEEKKKQKPIFKVGVVQRKITGSPILIDTNFKGKKNLIKPKQNDLKSLLSGNERKEGVITRSKAKKLELLNTQNRSQADIETWKMKSQVNIENKFCKIDVGQKNPLDCYKFKVPKAVSELPYSMKVTIPFSPKIKKKQSRKSVKETKQSDLTKTEEIYLNSTNENTLKNFSDDNNENIEKIDLEEKKEMPKKSLSPRAVTPEADNHKPIHYSPFVTKTSDKKRAKTPKKTAAIDVDEQIKKEVKEFQCRIFYFRNYIESETKRLLENCDKWKNIYEECQEIPAEIEGDIDSVIGKTKLLTSDKFKQFKELIDKCENGDPLIKVDDLQGFQDWVSIEVEKIDEDFYKIEKKKNNNWQEEPVTFEKKGENRDQKIKKNKKIPKAEGKSNIRSHIQAARKLLKEGVNSNPNMLLSGFSVEGTLKQATPKGRESILKDVLNSENKKKRALSTCSESSPLVKERRNSGLEIMIATQKSKLSTPAKNSPVLIAKDPVSIDQTPGKSILRKQPRSSKLAKGHVTFKKVAENCSNKRTGLDEKYFSHLINFEESPVRLVLGDVGNLTPSRLNKEKLRANQTGLQTLV